MSQDTRSARQSCFECHAGAFQFALHDIAGAMLFISEFRMSVKVVPDLDQFRQFRSNAITKR
jgi:hypothetical protein